VGVPFEANTHVPAVGPLGLLVYTSYIFMLFKQQFLFFILINHFAKPHLFCFVVWAGYWDEHF
jgi:hypothetical protein